MALEQHKLASDQLICVLAACNETIFDNLSEKYQAIHEDDVGSRCGCVPSTGGVWPHDDDDTSGEFYGALGGEARNLSILL